MRVFETWTVTGSELFSLLSCPHTAIYEFTLLSIFSSLEMSSPSMGNLLFRLPSRLSPLVFRRTLTLHFLLNENCKLLWIDFVLSGIKVHSVP